MMKPADPEISAVDPGKRAQTRRLADRPSHCLVSMPFRNSTAPRIRADERAERIERLAECQTEMAVLGLAERRGQRICGDLQDRDAARQHEQAEEHEIVTRRGWPQRGS